MIIKLNDWLYQGDYFSVHHEEYEQYDIRSIISVTEDDPPQSIFKTIKRSHLWIPFDDWGHGLTQRKLFAIKDFAHLMKDEGGILVHCYAGSNRSSAICILLLHLVDKIFLREAIKIVYKKNLHIGIEKKLIQKIEEELGITIKNP